MAQSSEAEAELAIRGLNFVLFHVIVFVGIHSEISVICLKIYENYFSAFKEEDLIVAIWGFESMCL